MPPSFWLLFALALCVGLSAFFSASETAFMSASHVRLKTLQQQGRKGAAVALSLAEDGDRVLTTILVGNNLVNIAGTAIATVLFTRWVGDMGATVSTAVMTVLILILGEVTPKTLARQTPERLAIAFAGPLSALMWILTPVVKLFGLWQKLILRIAKPDEEEADIEAELITMVDEALKEGDMDVHESSLIRSAIEFVDQDVKDIMTPRVDVTAIEDNTPMSEVAQVFRDSNFSRLPVYHEDMDHVIGVLNEKDFYAAQHRDETDLRRAMVPPVYCPATLKISKLLKLCQATRTHLVIVLDEFGGMEGIVTLEDALEELVGEIYDEHDDVSEEMIAQGEDVWQVSGSMQLRDCLARLDQESLADHYEADTVGGWAAEMLERIPAVGMSFEEEGLKCTVTAMDRRRVMRMRIERLHEAEPEAQPEEEKKEEVKDDQD